MLKRRVVKTNNQRVERMFKKRRVRPLMKLKQVDEQLADHIAI